MSLTDEPGLQSTHGGLSPRFRAELALDPSYSLIDCGPAHGEHSGNLSIRQAIRYEEQHPILAFCYLEVMRPIPFGPLCRVAVLPDCITTPPEGGDINQAWSPGR